MKRVLLAAVLGLAVPVSAAPPPDPHAVTAVRQAIQAVYDHQDAALSHKNVAGAMYGFAPNYREVHTERGVRGMSFTVAQLRPMLQSMVTLARWLRRTSVIQRTAMTPNGAIVTVSQHLTLVMPAPKVHQDGQVLTDSVLSDTWVKGKHGWQETRSVVVSGHMQASLLGPPKK